MTAYTFHFARTRFYVLLRARGAATPSFFLSLLRTHYIITFYARHSGCPAPKPTAHRRQHALARVRAAAVRKPGIIWRELSMDLYGGAARGHAGAIGVGGWKPWRNTP